MYPALKPLLFKLDPEKSHALTINLLHIADILPPLGIILQKMYAPPKTAPIKLFGLEFPNRVGLAAGYDKDGLAWRGLANLGFGHIEIGTVTPSPQPGNPKPRVFRLPEDRGLINRMGFPGQGAQVVAQRLKKKDQVNFILGVNLGKNKDTSLESAFEDYVQLIRVFAPLADYLAINISSPNTVGLRRLQNQKFLEILLTEIITARDQQAVKNAKRIPLLVKLSPDLAEEELIESLEVITSIGIDGVIATNTTISREGLKTSLAEEIGGLSGAPLTAQSTKVIRKISALTKGKLPIVAVGGIMTVENAKQKLDAGASIVQIYTGLIYNGPGFVKELLVGLA